VRDRVVRLLVQLEVFAGVVAVRRLLARRGLEPTLHRLGDRRARWGGRVLAPEVVTAAERAQRVLGRRTCLEEAVVIASVLTRHGRRPTIIVGCRRLGDGVWGAHAWTEVDGVRYDQQPAQDHQALARYAAASNWIGRPFD